MLLTELSNNLKIGKIYKTLPNQGDYSSIWLGVIGFRKGQVKVLDLSLDPPDVDNVDTDGRWAVKFDLSTERDPTSAETKAVEKALAIQQALPKEEQ